MERPKTRSTPWATWTSKMDRGQVVDMDWDTYVMGVRYSRIENWAIVARRQSTRLFLLNKPEKECLARRHAEGVEGPRTALSFLGVRAIRSASH